MRRPFAGTLPYADLMRKTLCADPYAILMRNPYASLCGILMRSLCGPYADLMATTLCGIRLHKVKLCARTLCAPYAGRAKVRISP